jgi:hypothetical protein
MGKMDETWSTHTDKKYNFLLENIKERDYFEDLGVEENAIRINIREIINEKYG